MPHLASADTPAPATVSAPEMARITGVGRERLRTWERRHGFPTPVRTPNGVRRYLAADVRRVVAIARSIESGVAVADAIRDELASPAPELSTAVAFDRALEDCSEPVIAIAGPAPLRVAWANGITLHSPDAPLVGEDLTAGTMFGGSTLAEFQELMQSTGLEGRVIEVRDWTQRVPRSVTVLAWRLTPTAAEEPTIVLMQLPQLTAAAPPVMTPDLSATTSWVRAADKMQAILREERGLSSAQRALAALLSTTGGLDGFLAIQRPDSLRAATSVTGALPARAIPRVLEGELDRAVGADTITWLSEHAAAALGTPARSRTLVVPLAAGGDRIGALFLVYRDVLDTPAPVPALLLAAGMTVALTLQREHLTAAAATRVAA